jgi:SAM-dependent methyltransferase
LTLKNTTSLASHANMRERIGAWCRLLLPSRLFLYERDGVRLPPQELRAAGAIFKRNRVFRRFAVKDVMAIERHVPLAGKSILDFGCGAGRLYFGLRQQSEPARYLGVDVRDDVIDWAQRSIGAANGKFAFKRADVHNERYNPRGLLKNDHWACALGDRFDIIYCYSVLTHLTESDADTVLNLFVRHAAPDALVFLTAFVSEQTERIVINPRSMGIEISGPLHVVCYRRDYFRDKIERQFRIVTEYAEAATDRQTLYVLRPRLEA